MKLSIHAILLLLASVAIILLAGAWREARRDSASLAATMAAQDATIKQAAAREKQRDTQLAAALAQIDAQKRRVRTPQQAERELLSVLPPLPLPVILGAPLTSLHPIPQEDQLSPQSSEASPASNPMSPPTSPGPLRGKSPTPSPAPHGSANPPSNISSRENPQSPAALAPPASATQPPARSTTPNPTGPETAPEVPTIPVKPDTTPTPTGTAATSTSTSTSHESQPYTSLLIPQPDLLPLYNALQDCRASALESEALKQDLSDEKTQSTAQTRERNAAITAAKGGTFLHHLKQSAKWFALGAAVAIVMLAAHPKQ